MIEKLQRIVHPPESPIDNDEAGLKRTLKALKTELPSDFLAYSRAYGTGTISVGVYEWEIYSAFRPTYPGFVKQFFKRQDAFRQAAETESVSLGLFPEENGLLPFGHRDDVYFCWRTEGDPDSWTVCVIWKYQEKGYQIFKKNFVDFMFALLTRKVKVAGFTSPWNPKKDITFTPEVYGG